MYLCVGVTIAGIIFYLWSVRKGRRETWGIYALVLTVSGGLAFLAAANGQAAVSGEDSGIEIDRQEPGDGSIEQDYELRVDDLQIKEPYQVVVENRHLTKQELETLFEQAAAELEQRFLGENESQDRITHPVEFPADVLEGRVNVSWTLDRYDAVNLNGELQRETLTDSGTLVCATAAMEYEGAEAVHQFSFMVYPPELSETEKFYELLKQTIDEENASTNAVFALPADVGGHRLVWKAAQNQTPYQILWLGVAAVIGIMVGRKEDARRRKQHRRELLLAEYPQMLGQMSLLIGAGMTVSYAWERLVRSYEEQKKGRNPACEQPVYEEMCTTYHQIRDGISERAAYEQFGERLQLSVYRRFSTLLVQNLRKGTAGLGRLLEKEMQEALDAQESNIKKRGEELQTKLLLPMMLMLGLVVVIIMIPAMASFQV